MSKQTQVKNGIFKETIDDMEGYVAYKNGKLVSVKAHQYKYRAVKDYDTAGESNIQVDTIAMSIPIGDRFAYLASLTRMVAKRQTPAMVLTGDGGLGKSHTVFATLEAGGFTEIIHPARCHTAKEYVVVKGQSTAKAIYEILHNNRTGMVIFDDCDAALENDTSIQLLKAALDTSDKRKISWLSAGFIDDGLDRTFEFTGGCIFISNMKLEKVDQAIRTRSLCVDLAMTLDQKIERMETIAKCETFMPTIPEKVKQMAMELVRENKDIARDLSLRSLVKVARVLNSGERNAKDLAKYMLLQG